MDKDKYCAMSFTLLKSTGFYQMVNPKGPKMFGYNIYHVIHIFIVVLTTLVTVFGLTGLVYNNDKSLNNSFQDMQMLFYIACVTIGNIKIIIIICNADEIWKTFDVEHESFLSNKYCKKNYFKINNCRKKSIRTLSLYMFLFYMAGILWIILPTIVNTDERVINKHIRKNNVVNLRYPIKVETYNIYYNWLYVIEAILCGYCTFGLVMFDIFILAKLQLIVTQYDILSSAYENIVFLDENEKVGKFSIKYIENDFLSITSDCQNIYKYTSIDYFQYFRNLKIICRISRPIVLIYMVGDSIGMITLPYIIVMCYVTNGSSIWNAVFFTNVWTFYANAFQLYMFCNLFQLIDDKKKYLDFGLYSSDWTSKDIKFKKRMLLTMRMHNTINRNIISLSPTKYIGLPMLAAIVQLSYKITYVMINSDIH